MTTVNVFIAKIKEEFGEFVVMCATNQLLLNGLNNIDFDIDKAIAEHTQKHANAEKDGKQLFTTLDFDISWCKCIKSIIDWINAEGKRNVVNNFIKLVKKIL